MASGRVLRLAPNFPRFASSPWRFTPERRTIPFMNQSLIRLASLSLAASMLCFAQAPKAPPPPKEQMVAQWNEVSKKLTDMAEQFPEDKYDYKPTPEVRTFADQLLHIAFWNQFVAKTAKGEKPDPKLNVLPRADYKTKADVAGVVKSSFADVVSALKAQNEDDVVKHIRLWSEFLEHAGEHYGQLVMYYRLNHLVPPESKGQ